MHTESLPDLNELLYNHTRSHTRLGGNLLYGGDDDDDDDAPSHDDQHAAKGRDGGLEVGEGVMYVGVTRKKGDGIVRVIGADGIKSDGQNGSIDNDDEVKVNGTAAHANKPSSINFDNAAVLYNAKSAVDGSNTGNSANDERKTDSLKVKAAFVVGHSEGKSIKARQASSPSHSETGLSQFAQVMQK